MIFHRRARRERREEIIFNTHCIFSFCSNSKFTSATSAFSAVNVLLFSEEGR